jgi:restriction system protein
MLIELHIEALARQRIRLVSVGAYGVTDSSKWNQEIQKFIDTAIFPQVFNNEWAKGIRALNPPLQEMVEEQSRSLASAIEADLSFAKDMRPQDFEHWCARVVSAGGWKAITTKASGDQGADVIAEKDGARLILQCKLYISPVGNKAVQEAFVAQHHYHANGSAVVTNATFTPSAIALAATTGVRLFHYSDLSRLDALLLT